MISQGCSEQSICFAVNSSDAHWVRQAVEGEFKVEFLEGSIELNGEKDESAILALVGDGMKGHPGVSGRLFGALGRANINILAIAQGSSEINISFVVESKNVKSAIQVVHYEFFEKKDEVAS